MMMVTVVMIVELLNWGDKLEDDDDDVGEGDDDDSDENRTR